jgi:DNA-binding NarL/FixJ family response regulator
MRENNTTMASVSSEVRARILVLDEHPVVREGLSLIINCESDLIACGNAGAHELLEQAVITSKPDLVTIDLALQNGDGLQLIRTLKSHHPSLPILVITQHDEMIYAERSLKSGARGYVMKQETTDKIVAAIRTVLAGGHYFSPRIAALALRRFGQDRSPVRNNKSGISTLSNRELQVLQLLGAGLGTRVIAHKLGLSVKTIEAHREHVKHKLGLSGAPQLLSYATSWLKGQSYHHSPDELINTINTSPAG